MVSLKWVAAATMIVIVLFLSTFAALNYVGMNPLNANDSNLPGPKPTVDPVTGYYAGPLNITFPQYDVYDGSAYTSAYPNIKVYHDAALTNLFGSTTTAAAVNGIMNSQDANTLYVVIDCTGQSTIYLQPSKMTSQPGVFTTSYTVADKPISTGNNKYIFTVTFNNLKPLTGGMDTQQALFPVWIWKTDVSFTVTSLTNATSADLSDTTYTDYQMTGYLTGIPADTAAKIVKVSLTLPDAANDTYIDDGKIKDIYLTLNTGPSSQKTFYGDGSYNYGNKLYTFNIGVTDTTQESSAMWILGEHGTSATTFQFTLHVKAANFAASAAWVPSLKLVYIDATGATGSVTREVSLTDT